MEHLLKDGLEKCRKRNGRRFAGPFIAGLIFAGIGGLLTIFFVGTLGESPSDSVVAGVIMAIFYGIGIIFLRLGIVMFLRAQPSYIKTHMGKIFQVSGSDEPADILFERLSTAPASDIKGIFPGKSKKIPFDVFIIGDYMIVLELLYVSVVKISSIIWVDRYDDSIKINGVRTPIYQMDIYTRKTESAYNTLKLNQSNKMNQAIMDVLASYSIPINQEKIRYYIGKEDLKDVALRDYDLFEQEVKRLFWNK